MARLQMFGPTRVATLNEAPTTGISWGLFFGVNSSPISILSWGVSVHAVTTPDGSPLLVEFMRHINTITPVVSSVNMDPDDPTPTDLWKPVLRPTLGQTPYEVYIAPDDVPFVIHRSYDSLRRPIKDDFWVGASHATSTLTLSAYVHYQELF